MAWRRLLLCAVLVVCTLHTVCATDNKTQPSGEETNVTDTSRDKSNYTKKEELQNKLDDPPYRSRSKDARYYVGRYVGSCRGKGMYYKDKFSFIICQHRVRHIQRCPAGTMNKDITQFHPRTFYDITPFCSINLNDYGYTVSKRKAFALHKGARTLSRTLRQRAAQGRAIPRGAAHGRASYQGAGPGRKSHKTQIPMVELKGSSEYQSRRPKTGSRHPVSHQASIPKASPAYQSRPKVIFSKQPIVYVGPSIMKGSSIGSHHMASKGRSREVRSAEWGHKDTFHKYPKHTKKDLSYGHPEEASIERGGWSSDGSPEYHSVEYGTYPPDRTVDVHRERHPSRPSRNKPTGFPHERPHYAETSYEMSAEEPHSRENSYPKGYHRPHSYVPTRKVYLTLGARSPREQLIKGSSRPIHHEPDSSVEYPIYQSPQKSNYLRRPADKTLKGDYYSKRPSLGLSLRQYKHESPHIPRGKYLSSPYKDSREWSTDKLYSGESHSEDIYPRGSHKGDNYSPSFKEQYGNDYSSEQRFSSVENEYESPQYKDGAFLDGIPELNSFETKMFGDSDFHGDNHFTDLLKKASYPRKSSKWGDSYPAPEYGRQMSSTKYSPYSEVSNTRHGAKTGLHLSRTSGVYRNAFESREINGPTDTFDDKGTDRRYPPTKPDDLENWLTDLSDIEAKYRSTSSSFENGKSGSSQRALFGKSPQSKELGFETPFNENDRTDIYNNEFGNNAAKNTPPKRSEAEWHDWLKDLSDVEQKYGDKEPSFQRGRSSEIHTMDLGTQGKSITSLGNSAGFETDFGTVNGSVENPRQDSDKDWSKWLTDLSDIAPQYEKSIQTSGSSSSDNIVLKGSSEVTEAPSADTSENHIEYNPFKKPERPKTEAEWDKWLKDTSDITPMVGRNEYKNHNERLKGEKNGAQGMVSSYEQSRQPIGRTPKLPYNQAYLKAVGNVKMNPGFGNNRNKHHAQPRGNNAAERLVGNQHNHGHAKSIGNVKYNPFLKDNVIIGQQASFNNNQRSGTQSRPLQMSQGQQNTQNHGRSHIPQRYLTDHSKTQYRKIRDMTSKNSEGSYNYGQTIQTANNNGGSALANVDETKEDSKSSETGEVGDVRAFSRQPIILSRMFYGNRYENERKEGSVRRQVSPLVAMKLHQVLTTPVYDESSGVTGQKIVLSAI